MRSIFRQMLHTTLEGPSIDQHSKYTILAFVHEQSLRDL